MENNATAERAALSTVVECDPGDTAALDRLAVLATAAGLDQEAARIRSRRAEFAAIKERYRGILRDDSTHGDPAELARLAGMLGRTAEARGWALLRDGNLPGPGRSRPPLAPEVWQELLPTQPAARGPMSADLCADLRGGAPVRQGAGPAVIIPRFTDEAETAGLRFAQDNGHSSRKRPPETMSGGVALLDYDGDGWLDVYAVQGGTLPPPPDAALFGIVFFATSVTGRLGM